MDLISKALQDIHANIPPQILEAAFQDNRMVQRGVPLSIDTRIREKVIDARVRVDCNLTGALQAVIPLQGIIPRRLDSFSAIYEVPKQLTQGRTITSVLSVSYGEAAHMPGSMHYMNNTSTLESGAGKILDSALDVPLVSSAYVQLIGENTVFIEGELSLPTNMFLRCWMTHDSEFSSIKPASYPVFTELAVLATKAYIYNQLLIPMDQGQLHFGMQLGSFREVVDSYADANQMYKEYLDERWRVTALLNDTLSWRQHLKQLSGGGR